MNVKCHSQGEAEGEVDVKYVDAKGCSQSVDVGYIWNEIKTLGMDRSDCNDFVKLLLWYGMVSRL